MGRQLLPPILLFILMICFAGHTSAMLVKQEKCAICHIYESIFVDEEFQIEDEGELWSSPDICMSCHNGSVVDSREALLTGKQHPTENIDGSFLAKGRVGRKRGCTLCHTPHTKLGWRGFAGMDISIFDGGEGLCVSCHPRQKVGDQVVNHGYRSKKGCLTCHKLHGARTDKLFSENYSDLCGKCHGEIFERGKKGRGHGVGNIRRKPVMITGRASIETAEKVDLNCYICHDIHVSRKNLLVEDTVSICHSCHRGYIGSRAEEQNNGNHSLEASCTDCHPAHTYDSHVKKGGGKDKIIVSIKVCKKCHQEKYESKEKKSHPISTGGGDGDICFSCHRMHRGVVGTPNLASKGDIVCINCHGEKNSLNEEVSRPLSHPVFDVLDDPSIINKISSIGGEVGKFKELICRSCHSIHAGKKEKLLISEYRDICMVCHDAVEIRHGKKDFSCIECHQVHGVSEEKVLEGSDPIRALCTGCHDKSGGHRVDIFSSSVRNRGRLPYFDSRGNRVEKGFISCPTCHDSHGKSSDPFYLREKYTGSAFLCVSCHEDKENIPLTPHDLRSIASDTLCEPCHQPHKGKVDLLWGLEGEGGEEKDTLCITCHREGGMATPVRSGEGHPVNIIPGIKEGIPFTYYDTSWKENELGMIACPTCHDVHGERVFMNPDSREGLLELTYTFIGESGLIERKNFCSLCHLDKREIVSGPHGRYGCEDCHEPHVNPEAPDGARTFSWFCVKCHGDVPSRDSTAFKIDGKKGAGGGVRMEARMLFDSQGRMSEEGSVSCPSCHEVHSGKKELWKSFKKGGEDDTCFACHPEKSSFIGSKHDFSDATGNGCVECHGICKESPPGMNARKRSDNEGANPADGKCLFCHERREGFFLTHPKNVTRVKSSYGAMVGIESDITMVSRIPGQAGMTFPLFDGEGKAGDNGTLACLTCHDPHSGNKMNSSKKKFLRDETGLFISAICNPCHRSDAMEHAGRFHSLERKGE